MDASRANQRHTRRVGPLRGDPVQFGADLYKGIAGPWAVNSLALLGPVKTGQEPLDIDRRLLGDDLRAGLNRLGERRRQRIPARAQDLQTVFGRLALRGVVGCRFHIVTL